MKKKLNLVEKRNLKKICLSSMTISHLMHANIEYAVIFDNIFEYI